MLFIAICIDKLHRVDTRLATRPAHLAYLDVLGSKVKIGGAILADDLKTPLGSVLIFEGESDADIRLILDGDPYNRAGLFESVTIKPWRQAVGPTLA